MEKKNLQQYKKIECNFDDICLFLWKNEHVKLKNFEYYYQESSNPFQRGETMSVNFPIEHTYEIFDLLNGSWGDFNECPDCQTMKKKAKEWYEKFGAELLHISYDTLMFQCRKLSEKEVLEIIADAEQLCAEIVDCEPENLIKYMMQTNQFTLWWD